MPKLGIGVPGLRVERDEPVARRDVEDSLIAPVGPVREAAAGQRTRRRGAALAFVLAMHPRLRAGRRVERDDGATRAAGRVQHAADHERRALELELRTRSERVGLEPPRDLERVEVASPRSGRAASSASRAYRRCSSATRRCAVVNVSRLALASG